MQLPRADAPPYHGVAFPRDPVVVVERGAGGGYGVEEHVGWCGGRGDVDYSWGGECEEPRVQGAAEAEGDAGVPVGEAGGGFLRGYGGDVPGGFAQGDVGGDGEVVGCHFGGFGMLGGLW